MATTTIIIVRDYWTLIICQEMFPAGHVAAFFILMKTEWCKWWDHPCFLEDGAKFPFWGLGLFWDRLKTTLGTVSGQRQDSCWHMAMALWRLGGTRLLGRGGLVQGSRLGFLKVRAFEQWERCLLRACSCWPRQARNVSGDGHFLGWRWRSQASWGGLFYRGDSHDNGCSLKSEGEEEEKKRWTRTPIICMVWGTKRKWLWISIAHLWTGDNEIQLTGTWSGLMRQKIQKPLTTVRLKQAPWEGAAVSWQCICSFQRCLPSNAKRLFFYHITKNHANFYTTFRLLHKIGVYNQKKDSCVCI